MDVLTFRDDTELLSHALRLFHTALAHDGIMETIADAGRVTRDQVREKIASGRVFALIAAPQDFYNEFCTQMCIRDRCRP